MIRLESICKTFNRGEANEVQALRTVNLHIKAGDFLVVIGSNGSGKSSLLNIISGTTLPTSGQIYLEGKDVSKLPEHKRSKWIARVFQDPLKGTASDLSIMDNFRLAALRTSAKTLKIGVDAKFLEKVKASISILGMGLENKVNQPVGTLSGGQRQALTLLMGVMDEAKILLLDEPSAALDPRSAELVMKTADKIISDYKLTAILITHQLKDAFRYGNRLVFMEEGKVTRDFDAHQKSALTETELYSWF